MKLTLLLSLTLAATATAAGNNDAFVPLVWDDECPPGVDSSYDFCATFEFCQHGLTFGYRNHNELDCGIHTTPLIRMTPGYKYLLVLQNTAGEPGNIHTHGLHIPGDGNSDDITRYADPGSCISYTYDVASIHQGGTFWYHAHVHFFTQRHVTGGAVGALIMDDLPSSFPDDGLVQFATNLDNELLLLGLVAGTSVFSNFDLSPEQWRILPNVWYRLRIVAVEETAAKIDVTLSSGCEGRAVQFDGVWVFSSPMAPASSWTLTGASRIDLAINCEKGDHELFFGIPPDLAKVADISAQNGSTGAPNATPFLSDGDPYESRAGTPDTFYLADLTQLGEDEIQQTFSTLITDDAVNFIPFNEDVPLEVGMGLGLGYFQYDTIQEWQLNFTVFHPFHLHVYHMQVVEPMGCAHHHYGEYYDTVSGDFMSTTCRVRFRTADYAGRVIFHCHILEHEDANAMAWINVTNGPELDVNLIDYCPEFEPLCAGEGETCWDDNDCCDGATGCDGGRPGNGNGPPGVHGGVGNAGTCNPFTEPFVPEHEH